jgi:filamentous hemagglutinin family protein
MNHIYRSIWSEALGTWIAVSENAKNKSKGKSSSRKVKILVAGLVICTSSTSVFALPTGNQLVAGQAIVSNPAANVMKIDQTSQKAAINWQGFSIAQHETVNIHQPNANAALLNRVVGQDASQIQGKLNANGQVYLVNPNGVIFSKTAKVDVGGLVASTHNISNADFMNGKHHFTQNGAKGKVENHGTINTTDHGVVALIGEQVTNTGTINTPKGTTALAAGKTVDLDFKGDGLIEVKVSEAALNAQINNQGAITADGGRVVMTAKAANQLIDTVINQDGIVKAQGLVERNGEIILDGGDNGTVKVSGTLDTSNSVKTSLPSSPQNITSGINLQGKTISLENLAHLNASGTQQAGNIHIGDKQHTEQVTLKAGSSIQADVTEQGNAGKIEVFANMNTGQVQVQGNIHADAPKQGHGSFIETSAAKVKVADSAKVSNKANNGNHGTWLIDPTDFTIAASGGDMTGAAVSNALGVSNFQVATSAAGTGNGDIFVNDAINWLVNTALTLNAHRNININANINNTGSAGKLALLYGQASLNGGTNDDYFVNAKVNLAAGQNFSTRKGTNAANLKNYTVITSLGMQGSTTATDLQGMNGNLNGLYALGGDIDATATSSWNAGAGFLPVGRYLSAGGSFKGSFDGLGHTINELTINRPKATDYVGLFGFIAGSIRNIGMVGGSVIGGTPYTGALGGVNVYGTVSNSYATVSVTGGNYVGGLLGYNDGMISNCYATGNVTGGDYIGGLIGYSYGGFGNIVSNSYATGSVSGITNVGGLAGYNSATINNTYATGNVIGNNNVGGLVGYNYNGTVSNSYATGSVTGNTSTGGLVGRNDGKATVKDSFWDTITTGQASGIGTNTGIVTNVLGKTTAELLTQSTYTTAPANWDFTNTWWLSETNTRPFLRSEYSTNISNNHQLQLMAMNFGANYTLVNNLNLTADLANPSSMWGTQSATVLTGISTGFSPIGNDTTNLTGSFDGQNHTITGLTINRPATHYVGLFGYNGGSIRNVGMVGGDVVGFYATGGLVGWNYGTVSNSYATGRVTGAANVTGGLVGYNTGTVSNSYMTGSVSGDTITGGLVGYNTGTVSNSYATGSVTGNTSTGGLVGYNRYGTVSNSYATGRVIGNTDTGGLVGSVLGTISYSYATGSVTGNTNTGGLVGWNRATVTNSYATGSVTGSSYTGGLIGYQYYSRRDSYTISNSFWDTSTTGQTSGIGFVGGDIGFTANNVLGKTTAEMRQMATFSNVGWSIANTGGSSAVWRIYEGYTAPLLRSFLTPVTITADNISKTYNGLNDSTVVNATYSIANVPSNGHLFSPYGSAKNVGNYPAYYSDQQGYDISLNNGLLTINPASLTITANNQSKTYGQTLGFTGTEFISSGLVNDETISTVSLSSLGADANAPVKDSPYSITASNATGGTFNPNNYNVTYHNGTLIVNRALLTITANSQSKTYGQTRGFIGTEFVSSGLVNDETISTIRLSSLGADANAPVAGSPYALIASNATGSKFDANNYSIIYINGTLTVNPASLTPFIDDSRTRADNISGLVASAMNDSTTKVQNLSSPAAASEMTTDTSSSVDAKTSVQDTTEEFSDSSQPNLPFFSFITDSDDFKQAVIPSLEIKNSAGRVKSLRLSVDKQFLSLLLEDGSVRVWDFQRGVQRNIVASDNKQTLTDVGSVDKDGEMLPVASAEGIGVYDIIGSLLNDRLAINEPDVEHFVSSDDGSLLLAGIGAGYLTLWDSQQKQQRWQLPYQRGDIKQLTLNKDKHYAAVLSRQPKVYVYDLAEGVAKPLTDAVDIIDLTAGKVVKSLPNFGEDVLYMRFKDPDTLQLGLASGELVDWSMTSNSQKTALIFSEPVLKIDAEQGTYAYIAKNGDVRVSNEQGDIQLSIENSENNIEDAKLLADGKKLLTVLTNGNLALWDIVSGKKMLRLFSSQQNGWTVIDALGRFDGSDEAIENFNWIAADEKIPLNNFSENYYEPGLLANVVHDQDFLNKHPDSILGGIRLPPKVDMQLLEQPAQADKVAVKLEVYDRGGGINKVYLYHNGKALSDDHIVAEQTAQNTENTEKTADHRTLTVNVTPTAGKNTLKVVASNNMGIENSGSEINFDGKSKAYISSLRLLTVGVSRYNNNLLNLHYSVADAELIGQTLKNTSPKVTSKQLTDDNATKAHILADLKELSQGAQQDVLVIYLAGHGIAVGKEWYFLPYDTKLLPTEEQIVARGGVISATELSDIFKDSKIQHIFLMVDACYSGAGIEAFNNLQNGQRYLSRRLGRSLGITIIAAAAKDQQAFELKSLGHGLFTYSVAQQINNKETGKRLTAHTLAENITKTLPKISKEILGNPQEPSTYTKGNDFMLTDMDIGKQ